MPTLFNFRKELKLKADPKKAKILQRFFKTGKGEYGEGDMFLGISVPEIRKIARKYSDLKLKEISELLKSKIHEERVAALRILVNQFQGTMLKHSVMLKHNTQAGDKIFNFYLKNTKYINNWDLVDLSAPKIVGEYLLDKPKIIRYKLLRQLAESKNLWERRIAILATYAFIKKNQFKETLKIAEKMLPTLRPSRRRSGPRPPQGVGVLNGNHDLIHKAVGWMLREVGKKSQKTLEKFLKKNASKMPRVMLRYAIERLPEEKRREYLKN